jgi:hypothetical protein
LFHLRTKNSPAYGQPARLFYFALSKTFIWFNVYCSSLLTFQHVPDHLGIEIFLHNTPISIIELTTLA